MTDLVEFNRVMALILRGGNPWRPQPVPADLDYADDVRRRHRAYTGEVGLPISKPKTKAMGIGETVADIHFEDDPRSKIFQLD
jgi:hypothetical protein